MYEIPFADQTFYPMLLTLLYTPLVAHVWESAAKFLHLAFGLGASAVVCLYLRTRFTDRLAAARRGAAVHDADGGRAGGQRLRRSRPALLWRRGDRRVAALVGIAAHLPPRDRRLGAGCAATVKYNGILLVPLLRRRTHPAVRQSARLGAGHPCGVVVASRSPSSRSCRGWRRTSGRRAIPSTRFFTAVFGGRPLPPRPSIDMLTYRRTLYGESWLDIVLVPLRVFVTGRDGDPARFDGVFNPIFLLGFVAALLPAASRRTRVLAGTSAASASPRLLPHCCSAAATRSPRCSARHPGRRCPRNEASAARRTCGAPPAATMVALRRLRSTSPTSALFVARLDPLPYWRGDETREQFIARFVPEYPVATYANDHLPADATVYLAFLGQRGYYWRRPYTYDFHFSGVKLRDAVESAKEPDEIAAVLHREGISAHRIGRRPVEPFHARQPERAAASSAGADLPPRTSICSCTRNGVSLYEVV